jgi:glycosyltransferase involved in cell wall biosynthesis
VKSCHIVTRLNVGGIARFLEVGRDAVDTLVRGRVEPGEIEAPWAGPEVDCPEMRRSIAPLRDRRALHDLLGILERLQPDVVHTHASKAGALGRTAARRLGIPCVHTFHGHVLSGYFGRLRSGLFRAAERRLARTSRITATGPATARELERLLDAPVEVIAPGVALPAPDPDARARWRRGWGDPERVALLVGRGAAVKQTGLFVAAARDAGYLPVVAGASAVPGALALGTVAHIEEVYAAADVVVCSSRREGTPYALLEAMWSGRPVVAHPVGDVPWVIGDAGMATWDLADGLARLRDPELREEIGARAAGEVRRRFPASALAPRLRALYAAMV